MIDIPALYNRFFELGGPKTKAEREAPWRYRRRCTSLRLPGCQLLAELVRTRHPERVLDLGSGLTSHVLRSLQQEAPGMLVVTTDTAPGWLEMTVAELRRDGWRDDHCYVHGKYTPADGQFDLISLDLGSVSSRVAVIPDAVRWLAPKGIILLDDWHTPGSAERMDAELVRLGLVVTPRPDTKDQFGGFVATAERPAAI